MKKNVTFKNRAINMAGNLYLPNDFSDNKKYAWVGYWLLAIGS